LNPYELILVFDSSLGEEKIDALLAKIEGKIKDLGGEIEKTDKWGTRRLASMMKKARKVTQAYYVLICFKAQTAVPGGLQKYLKVQENVIRYSLVRAEAHSAAEGKSAPLAAGDIQAVEVGEIKGEAAAPSAAGRGENAGKS
jgi:small subunit ribosomal protein S6